MGWYTDLRTRYANQACLVDFLWQLHVDFTLVSDGYGAEGILTLDCISDPEQCQSMTGMARTKGCFAEDSAPCNGRIPTVLFAVSQTRRPDTSACQYARTIKQLLVAGFSREFRNSEGQTPLLYSAFIPSWRSLTTLKILLAEKMDVHAVDNHGRNALHNCLRLDEGLSHVYGNVCRRSTWAWRAR